MRLNKDFFPCDISQTFLLLLFCIPECSDRAVGSRAGGGQFKSCHAKFVKTFFAHKKVRIIYFLSKKVMSHYFFIQKDVNHYFLYKLVMHNYFFGQTLCESLPFVYQKVTHVLFHTKSYEEKKISDKNLQISVIPLPQESLLFWSFMYNTS